MEKIDSSQLVYEMAHNVLSNADLKAISKIRGFSDKAATSRSLFENAFLSATGLEAAMRTLTPAEKTLLHLLYFESRTVDVSFFERIYGTARTGSRSYGTFNQQFKPIFDLVQTNLIRKGLLIINEAKTSALNKTRMELWRYRFPPEFGEYLPSLLPTTARTTESGSSRQDLFRKELLELVQAGEKKKAYPGNVNLRDGTLYIGEEPFSMGQSQEWQQARWLEALNQANTSYYSPSNVFQGYLLPGSEYRSANPLPFVGYALSQLKAEEWVVPGSLDTLLEVYYNNPKRPAGLQLCETGYKTGCLVRHSVNGNTCYRLPDERHSPTTLSPEEYLKVLADGTVEIKLEKIPYSELELLNRATRLEANHGQLKVLPDLPKLSDVTGEVLENPVLTHLKASSPLFKEAFANFEARWGKLILHEKLLVARVTDLSLRLQLQRAFGNSEGNGSTEVKLLSLPGDFIAFPRAMLGEVEKLVKKAGHIVKTVEADKK